MRVLAVKIDERSAALGQLAHGRQPAVDVRAAAAVERHHPREHDLVAGGVDESAFDPRLRRAVAHDRRVGSSADEQLERLDDAASSRCRSRR